MAVAGCQKEPVAPLPTAPPAKRPVEPVRDHGFQPPAKPETAEALLLAADAQLLDGSYAQAGKTYRQAVDRLLAENRRQDALFVARQGALLLQAVARQLNKEPFLRSGTPEGQPTPYQLAAMGLYRRYVDLLADSGPTPRVAHLLSKEIEERRQDGVKGSYLTRIAFERAAELPGYHGAQQCAYQAALERQWRYPHGDLEAGWEDARATWQRFLERHPTGPYAACAGVHVAELHKELCRYGPGRWLKTWANHEQRSADSTLEPQHRERAAYWLAKYESKYGSPAKLHEQALAHYRAAKELLEAVPGQLDLIRQADLGLEQRLKRELPQLLRQLEESRQAADRSLAEVEAGREG
jgi:hypothetical protein